MLASNQIYLGDCLDLMGQIDDNSIDMIATDLPYGVLKCKWDSIIPFEPLWYEYTRNCWVWHKTRPGNFPLAKKQPMKYHEDVVVFGVKSPQYFPQMTKGNKIRKKGKNEGYRGFNKGLENPVYLDKEYKDSYPSSIQTFPHHNGGLIHPTQKPVSLFEYLIKTYTEEGDLVLDNCAGSGTTGVAALNTARDFLLIEKDPEYFKKAKERVESHATKRN